MANFTPILQVQNCVSKSKNWYPLLRVAPDKYLSVQSQLENPEFLGQKLRKILNWHYLKDISRIFKMLFIMSKRKKRNMFKITYSNSAARFTTCTNSSFHWLVAVQPASSTAHSRRSSHSKNYSKQKKVSSSRGHCFSKKQKSLESFPYA